MRKYSNGSNGSNSSNSSDGKGCGSSDNGGRVLIKIIDIYR